MKLKLIIPACLAAILAACATPPPTPGTEAHQRMLEEQARENFYALKAQERASHPAPAPTPIVAREVPPAKVRLKPFNPFVSANPAPSPKPVAFAKPTPKPAAPARPLAAAKPAPVPKSSSPSTFSSRAK